MKENTKNIPVIGRNPEMTVGLIARLYARHHAAQTRRPWINRINALIAAI